MVDTTIQKITVPWDVLAICSEVAPTNKFFAASSDDFDGAFIINTLRPLRLLRGLYNYRNAGASAVFFSHADVDVPRPYEVSKLALIRACEALDAETSDARIFSLGTSTASHDDIYSCLRFCMKQPKEVIGGRHIHAAFDQWKAGRLREGYHAYRLRRC